MPYKIEGSDILHFKGGKWSVKQNYSSHANAVKAMGLLQGLEHGTIKPSEVGKKRKIRIRRKKKP